MSPEPEPLVSRSILLVLEVSIKGSRFILIHKSASFILYRRLFHINNKETLKWIHICCIYLHDKTLIIKQFFISEPVRCIMRRSWFLVHLHLHPEPPDGDQRIRTSCISLQLPVCDSLSQEKKQVQIILGSSWINRTGSMRSSIWGCGSINRTNIPVDQGSWSINILDVRVSVIQLNIK